MNSGRERLFLIHWNKAEAEKLGDSLRQAGWPVEIEAGDGKRAWETVRTNPPRGLVISLDRLPSHSRQTALAVRSSSAGRTIPIVFVGGEPGKFAAVRARIPDALYLAHDTLVPALQDAFGGE